MTALRDVGIFGGFFWGRFATIIIPDQTNHGLAIDYVSFQFFQQGCVGNDKFLFKGDIEISPAQDVGKVIPVGFEFIVHRADKDTAFCDHAVERVINFRHPVQSKKMT